MHKTEFASHNLVHKTEFESHDSMHKTEFVSHSLVHKTEFVNNNLKFAYEMTILKGITLHSCQSSPIQRVTSVAMIDRFHPFFIS